MSIKTARTTNFIVKGDDFFVAQLDNGGVRIGMVGGVCFNLLPTHASYERCIKIASEAQAEEVFDKLYGAFPA